MRETGRERERERERAQAGERQRDGGRGRIPSRLYSVSDETDKRLDLTNHDFMT